MVATWKGQGMARPKKDAQIDLSDAQDLTAGLIERLACPPGKLQAFMRDTKAPGLRVRVTASSAKSFVFEAKLNRQTIRRTLGDVRTLSIEVARDHARELARTIKTQKQDPRALERQQNAARASELAAAAAHSLTVGEVWPRYLEEGKPKRKPSFKPRYLADLQAMAGAGGIKKKRGEGLTRPGPLYPLLALALGEVNEDSLKSWYDREAKSGEHQAARALMMFRGFLRWCAGRPEYRTLIDRDAGRAASIVEGLPSTTRRTDAIEAAQVPGWWSAAEQLNNRIASVYLRSLLLTGARREEMAALKWTDIDFQWLKLTLADKVEVSRVIPLTPYLAQHLASLPRVNEYVFTSKGKSGRITDTRASHLKVLKSAGIEGLTIHGLRRSFSLLGEAAGAPAGAIAQVMGHKPSATAEGYRPRSVDALRPYLAQIEEHILGRAGVQFVADLEARKLRAVA